MTLLKVERFATFIDDLSNGCIAAREQFCNELCIFMAFTMKEKSGNDKTEDG